ncbi:hypothetical protein HDE69_004547 [Pedobacter cryoconitis]|uniref:Uncharacterized protein n=1 Tax=Pedobacter cryoconitis TaxID=188932 RepID=A0A7W8YX69_9SPHI|nr:hypothetical protein [Pedobacter cryoconitis]
MAKAWYLYDGSGNPFVNTSYNIYNPSSPLTQPPCQDGCRLCAIQSTTAPGPRPISPLSNNVQAYLTTFFIAQVPQPNTTFPYVVGKKPC